MSVDYGREVMRRAQAVVAFDLHSLNTLVNVDCALNGVRILGCGTLCVTLSPVNSTNGEGWEYG